MWQKVERFVSNVWVNFTQTRAEVSSIIKYMFDLSSWHDSIEKCVMVYTVEDSHVEVIKELLESGCEFDVEDSSGMTPIVNAVMSGHFEELKTLYLAHVIDSFNKKMDQQMTTSFEFPDWQIFKTSILTDLLSKLKEKQFDSQQMDEISAKINKYQILDLACVVDPDFTNDDFFITFEQDSLFCNTCQVFELVIPSLQHVKVVLQASPSYRTLSTFTFYRYVMKNICDFQRTDEDILNKEFSWESHDGSLNEVTLESLEEALKESKRNEIEVFLQYSSHLTIKEKCGRDLFASLFGNVDPTVISLLTDEQIDVNGRGYDDNTPLHFATNRHLVENTRLLLDKGADPNALNENQDTPLELIMTKYSYDQADYECVKLLLLAGANPFLTSNHIQSVEVKYILNPDLSSNYCLQIIKLLIAQACVYEALGQSIEDPIKAYLDFLTLDLRQDFYEECKRQLNQLKKCKISAILNNPIDCKSELSMFTVLTEKPEKAARYFVEEDFQVILTFAQNNDGKLNAYYEDLLKKHIEDIIRINRGRDEAIKLICKCTGINDPHHLVIDQIVGYLTAADLKKISIECATSDGLKLM